MFPLLLASPIFSAVGTIASGSMSLAGKAVSTAVKAASSSEKISEDVEKVVDKQGKEHDANSPTGRMVVNMTKDEKDEEPKEMFGGMDLGKIKSALDEDSPLGMPEEVKGGVYKQIFEVNKMMLGSLQRMEKTMKLLLEVEYERIKGMVSQERQETITEGDTDNKVGESGGNRFGDRLKSGAKSVGGMLGSAYGKVKGGLTGTFGKLLGLGALIFAFKNYKEEIINAMAKVLEFFKGVYDYFSADDFTFAQFKSDLASKFLPAVKKFLADSMEWLWGAIKGVASEFLFGAKGDKRIRQESGSATQAKSNTVGIMKEVGVKMQDLNILGSSIQNIEVDGKKISKEDSDKLTKQHQDLYLALNQISRKSEGRIQWTGLGDLNKTLRGNRAAAANVNVMDLLNAQPIVDGRIMSMKDLETIEMNKLGGITRGMTDDKQKEIKDALAKKTTLVMQKMNLESDTYDPNKIQDFGDALMGALTIGKTGEEYYALEKADKIKVIEEALLKVDEDLEYSGQVFMEDDVADVANITGTTGTTANTKSLATDAQIKAKKIRDDAKVARLFAEASMNRGGSPSAMTQMIDQSQTQVINSGLNGFPNNDTVKAVNYKEVGASY